MRAETENPETPPEVAARMVEYLGTPTPAPVLDAGAGTGNLTAALLQSGLMARQIAAVENDPAQRAVFRRRFPTVVATPQCFLDWVTGVADIVQLNGIVMHPPASAALWHLTAARSLMSPSTALVALVPTSVEVPKAQMLQRLPADTLQGRWKIIRVRERARS